jgi:hypothetical protein
MTDEDLHKRIEELAHEEHTLLRMHGADKLSAEEHARLADVEQALDRAWDLLRQRDARRTAGMNPDEAQERPAGTVDGYLQ